MDEEHEYKYVVLTADNTKDLERQVEKHMGDGFIPTGGVTEIKGQIAQAVYYIPDAFK